MNVLLLSMPDSFEHMPTVAIRMPNGALASLAGNVDPHHRVAIADLVLAQSTRHADDRAADPGAPAGRRRPLGHDVPARHRVQDRAARADASRRDAESSSAATIPASRPEAYERAPATSTSSFAARASRRCASCCARWRAARACESIGGLSYRTPAGPGPGKPTASSTIPMRPIAASGSIDLRLPNRAARVLERLHAARPSGRRRRDVARLHLRLQLLLDHRDARPQLPPLSDRARAGRHRRRARARRARDLPGRRQHHARYPPVRVAVPGDHRQRLQRRRLHRAGDDGAARAARRHARAADAAGRIPLRVSRHREHARRRPGVSQGARQERAPRKRPHGRQRHDRGDRASASPRACSSSAASSSAIRTTRASRSRRISHSPGDTSTGRTSSIRRRIRGRR